MGVKLFSHASDPDGLGSVVLASLIFKDLKFTLCKNNDELNTTLETFINSKDYLKFDQIYITDLCPSDKILKRMEGIPELENKTFVFDHHKTSKEALTKKYFFVTVEEEKDGKKVCGTSLFYEFLKDSFPQIDTPYIQGFVEHTRLHDTWEWKAVGNMEAYQLDILFQYLGCYGYYYHFLNNCNQKTNVFRLDEVEKEWIQIRQKQIHNSLEALEARLRILKEENILYGTVIGKYEFRNSFAEHLKTSHPELDICILLAYDNGTVSFRSLKEKPVEPLARAYGGSGHPGAASCALTRETELKLIKRFMMGENS